jgi:hypothetical protein
MFYKLCDRRENKRAVSFRGKENQLLNLPRTLNTCSTVQDTLSNPDISSATKKKNIESAEIVQTIQAELAAAHYLLRSILCEQ